MCLELITSADTPEPVSHHLNFPGADRASLTANYEICTINSNFASSALGDVLKTAKYSQTLTGIHIPQSQLSYSLPEAIQCELGEYVTELMNLA